MPRVYTKTKNRAGRERRCGKCGETIEPGQTYFTWEFRYGGARYRHTACGRPRPSELTQSKMSTVYAAIEGAEDALQNASDIDEVNEIVREVAEAVQEVADEYREADEAFGGQGATESAERADELEGWASELEDFEAEAEDEPDEDVIREEVEAEVADDMLGDMDLTDEQDDEASADPAGYVQLHGDAAAFEARVDAEVQQRMQDAEEEAGAEILDAARTEAEGVLGGCPL